MNCLERLLEESPKGLKKDIVKEEYDIAVLCYVKSGRRELEEIDLEREKLKQVLDLTLSLFGFRKSSETILRELEKHLVYVEDKRIFLIMSVVRKLGGSNDAERDYVGFIKTGSSIPYLCVTIRHILRFLIQRISNFRNLKSEGIGKYYSRLFELLILLHEQGFLSIGYESNKIENT